MFAMPAEAAQKVARNAHLLGLLSKGQIYTRVISSLDADALGAGKVLLELRSLFQKQLPKMPKEYVTRLVFDVKHKSMVLLEGPEEKIVGGICYRLFFDNSFVEIVFCAVNSESQIKGFGEFMMCMLRETIKKEFRAEEERTGQVRGKEPIYLLTYADNYAIGYFKKQGFTKQISFTEWQGRIKDYEGGTMMQGRVLPELDYLQMYGRLQQRRAALIEMVKQRCPEMYKEYVMPESLAAIEDIPGLAESGFNEQMKAALGARGSLKELLLYLCNELQNHNTAWPFLEPVSAQDVPDYYQVIKNPMDLSTIQQKIQSDQYTSFDEMDQDIQQIVQNCYIYNAPGSQYAKCAKSLNEFYQNKVKWCREALSRR
ncbi:histone acetyltransferase [Nematocida homosporus]|uniref:histone acetyltransferase n=1 Tax=Nematocida homosporus TaxID=1912981 RepID=UPI00221F351B|nr:histone acetyltransferase [Nematocida homosporus]KAI5185210.1 histone acetyltransferase [Nematocida homosporus]